MVSSAMVLALCSGSVAKPAPGAISSGNNAAQWCAWCCRPSGPRGAAAKARARYAAAQGFHRPDARQGPRAANVYMTSRADDVPVPLLHNLTHKQGAAPADRAVACCHPECTPVPPDKRVEVTHLGDDFHAIVAHYGFMQSPNVPRLLAQCRSHDPHFDMMDASFSSGGSRSCRKNPSHFGIILCKLFEAVHCNALAESACAPGDDSSQTRSPKSREEEMTMDIIDGHISTLSLHRPMVRSEVFRAAVQVRHIWYSRPRHVAVAFLGNVARDHVYRHRPSCQQMKRVTH
jgi:hypothetical protein